MKKIMDIITEFFTNIPLLILSVVFSSILTAVLSLISSKINNYRIRRFFRLSSKECMNCLITWTKILKLNGREKVPYTRYKDAELMGYIYKLCSRIKSFNISYDRKIDVHYDLEIHIGTVPLNDDIYRYILQEFPDFKWYISDSSYNDFFC